MKNNYDVVIIGAGISGLMAGALLAKKDEKALILESQPKIGGYLSGFERKGYYFDVGITPFFSSRTAVTVRVVSMSSGLAESLE